MRVLVFCLVMGMVQGQGGGGFMQLMQIIGGGAPEIFPEDSKVLAVCVLCCVVVWCGAFLVWMCCIVVWCGAIWCDVV